MNHVTSWAGYPLRLKSLVTCSNMSLYPSDPISQSRGARTASCWRPHSRLLRAYRPLASQGPHVAGSAKPLQAGFRATADRLLRRCRRRGWGSDYRGARSAEGVATGNKDEARATRGRHGGLGPYVVRSRGLERWRGRGPGG